MFFHPRQIDKTRHLRQADLAQRWGISPRTLERWRWLGKGPPYLKLGGSVAYDVADVIAFEAAQRHMAQDRDQRRLTGPERSTRGLRG